MKAIHCTLDLPSLKRNALFSGYLRFACGRDYCTSFLEDSLAVSAGTSALQRSWCLMSRGVIAGGD